MILINGGMCLSWSILPISRLSVFDKLFPPTTATAIVEKPSLDSRPGLPPPFSPSGVIFPIVPPGCLPCSNWPATNQQILGRVRLFSGYILYCPLYRLRLTLVVYLSSTCICTSEYPWPHLTNTSVNFPHTAYVNTGLTTVKISGRIWLSFLTLRLVAHAGMSP